MSATERDLAAAIDAILSTPKVTYLRTEATHPAPNAFGTRYDVVVVPATLHVPAGPPRPAGTPPNPAVLHGGEDLDA